MKKFISFILCAVMLISVAAASSAPPTITDASVKTISQGGVYTITREGPVPFRIPVPYSDIPPPVYYWSVNDPVPQQDVLVMFDLRQDHEVLQWRYDQGLGGMVPEPRAPNAYGVDIGGRYRLAQEQGEENFRWDRVEITGRRPGPTYLQLYHFQPSPNLEQLPTIYFTVFVELTDAEKKKAGDDILDKLKKAAGAVGYAGGGSVTPWGLASGGFLFAK